MHILPIMHVLPELKQVLASHTNAVLIAPPGAGKTTQVPLALLEQSWLARQHILLLEPRRLATRSVASYMAQLLGEEVGDTVGYRVRHDTKVGPASRIEVITEGILTRMLQADPALTGVGLVIFDEFHERNLQADIGLALCLQSQEILRPDLKLLVMSATLDAKAVAKLMLDAPVLISEGKAYPVETIYLDRRMDERLENFVAHTVMRALIAHEGDLLVFLPGAREIRMVEARLKVLGAEQYARIRPLHGNLPQNQQDLAIRPSIQGERKVVLTTSIAETSLTVEGVRIVVDSGLMRVPRFSPRTGLTRLETVAVSRSSADQRRGRAGRLTSGICYRLWTAQEHERLQEHSLPEMLEADLAALALELAAWGVTDPDQLAWLTVPPQAAFSQARGLLYQLGAIREDHTITPHGRNMVETGLHPRLAHMVLKAASIGFGGIACEIAVMLTERDIFRQPRVDADLRLRLEAIRCLGQAEQTYGRYIALGADRSACQRIAREASYLKIAFEIEVEVPAYIEDAGIVLAFAYPDRIAQQKMRGHFLLSNGRGAFLADDQTLAGELYLVAAELDDKGTESRIGLAVPISKSDIKLHFAEQIETKTVVLWDSTAQTVRASVFERLGALTLQQTPLQNPDAEVVLQALLEGLVQEGLAMLPWGRSARQLQQRINFLHNAQFNYPDVSDETLLADISKWLSPYLYGLNSRADLQRLNLADILLSTLDYRQCQQLEELAPTHITVPSGSRIAVDYSDPDCPVLAVRLQEVFGLPSTPCIAGGRIPLTLQLLSPAQRPVQVTKDLANFWNNTYFEVKKDLMGRYPKHYWPDDPLTAKPTNRAKPKM